MHFPLEVRQLRAPCLKFEWHCKAHQCLGAPLSQRHRQDYQLYLSCHLHRLEDQFLWFNIDIIWFHQTYTINLVLSMCLGRQWKVATAIGDVPRVGEATPNPGPVGRDGWTIPSSKTTGASCSRTLIWTLDMHTYWSTGFKRFRYTMIWPPPCRMQHGRDGHAAHGCGFCWFPFGQGHILAASCSFPHI